METIKQGIPLMSSVQVSFHGAELRNIESGFGSECKQKIPTPLPYARSVICAKKLKMSCLVLSSRSLQSSGRESYHQMSGVMREVKGVAMQTQGVHLVE